MAQNNLADHCHLPTHSSSAFHLQMPCWWELARTPSSWCRMQWLLRRPCPAARLHCRRRRYLPRQMCLAGAPGTPSTTQCLLQVTCT